MRVRVSLNPVFTVGHQIEEAIIIHQGLNKEDAREKVFKEFKLLSCVTI